MTPDLQWDDEVDVVCTDAGVAGLAGAISAVDEGAEVLVAGGPVAGTPVARGGYPGWFACHSGDIETAEYLNELAGDLDVATLPQLDADLPIRSVAPAVAPGRTVPPFLGSELRTWMARCIPSPSGYLYTRVTDWTSASMDSGDGDTLEVSDIGSLTTESGDIVSSLLDWLDAEAHMRGVGVHPVLGFERLVFGQGDVIGAVFTTADGPLTVRARHGVLFCRAAPSAGRAAHRRVNDEATLRVAMVGKAASRFGRVELLDCA